MTNPDFSLSRAVAFLSFAAAIILLSLACILPELAIQRLCDKAYGILEQAITAADGEDFAKAERLASDLIKLIGESSDMLKLTYDHGVVFELECRLESAYYIARAKDAAQLLEELCGAKTNLQDMLRSNEASLVNLI